MPADDESRAVQPELAVALAHFAQAFNRQQHALPRWMRDSLQAYGIACFRRGVAHAHQKKTVPKPIRDVTPWDADDTTPLVNVWDDE